MAELIYQDIPRIGREIAVRELESNETSRVVQALLALAFHEKDHNWVETICIDFASNPNDDIRGIAVLCFGHLARIHRKMNTDDILPIIAQSLNDPSILVRDHAESSLSDILMYCIHGSYSREGALQDLDSGQIPRMLLALSSISKKEQDWRVAQDICVEYSRYPSTVVQGVAMLEMATIASIHGELDTAKVFPLLTSAAENPNLFVSGSARSAMDCISTFMGITAEDDN